MSEFDYKYEYYLKKGGQLDKSRFYKEYVQRKRSITQMLNSESCNDTFEIYYRDLNETTQQDLLKFYGITDPKNLNWDCVPLVTL